IVQIPDHAFKHRGETLAIRCSHGIQSYDQILWYRQTADRELQLLGYMYGTASFPDKESFNKSKYSAVKDAIETGALTVKDLQPDDSGIYFCAVSKHSDLVFEFNFNLNNTREHSYRIFRTISHLYVDFSSTTRGLFSRKKVTSCSHRQKLCALRVCVSSSLPFPLQGSVLIIYIPKICLYICLSKFAGFSLGIDIHQFPSNIVGNTSDDVQLFCSHKQSSYRVILWYQKTPGDQALNLIGYGYGQISNDSVEEKFRKHFRLGGDLAAAEKNLSLSIVGLKAEHTATYFCAARRYIFLQIKMLCVLIKILMPSATGFSLSAVNFQQLPSVFVKVGDQSVTLWCDQDNNQNYYMFWYRHPADSGKMELVAYSVGKDAAAIEAPFSKTKYTLTRPEVLRTSLQIHSPEAADSAVYYCASSLAQCFRLPEPPNNN
uniref:Ig-like domain-containing protein n=1 Tax=Poecilia formosa TaxID=48698 RepID=A0A096M447_POEFO